MRALDRGLALAEKGEWNQAISHYETALREKPGDPATLFALGRAASALGSLEAAIGFFARVVAHDPDRIEAVVKLAEAYASAARHTEAVELLQSSLPRLPEEPVLWITLGNVVREQRDLDNAETFFREALRLKPKSAEALGNLADLLSDRGKFGEAKALYEQAIKIAPNNAQLRFNRALLSLSQGDVDLGWQDYEFRLRIASRGIERNHGLKRWSGKPRNGKGLLVCSEQGIGDQILFASCIPSALKDGPVTLECEPRLVSLFERSFPAATVHAHDLRRVATRNVMDYTWLKALERPDAFIELASLPSIFRRTRGDYPAPHAYLHADPDETNLWRSWLSTLGTGPKIGLCWRSGKTSGQRSLQYAPLEQWAAFARTLDATLVCAQYDVQADELAALEQAIGRKVHNPPALDQRNDIVATASLLSALDAVVSAPTAVAALSGALGVPTLKLLYDKTWTNLGEDIEPLAPSVRCIRPQRPGDWTDVFAQAAGALAGIGGAAF